MVEEVSVMLDLQSQPMWALRRAVQELQFLPQVLLQLLKILGLWDNGTPLW